MVVILFLGGIFETILKLIDLFTAPIRRDVQRSYAAIFILMHRDALEVFLFC